MLQNICSETLIKDEHRMSLYNLSNSIEENHKIVWNTYRISDLIKSKLQS